MKKHKITIKLEVKQPKKLRKCGETGNEINKSKDFLYEKMKRMMVDTDNNFKTSLIEYEKWSSENQLAESMLHFTTIEAKVNYYINEVL
jgi:hypothetical protein